MKIEEMHIGDTVLSRIGCDMYRVHVDYMYRDGDGYLCKVSRMANHAGRMERAEQIVSSSDIVEVLVPAPHYDGKGYIALTTDSNRIVYSTKKIKPLY